MGFNKNYMKDIEYPRRYAEEPLYIKEVNFKHFVAMFRFYDIGFSRKKESLTASFYPYGDDSWVESNFQLHYDERVKEEAKKYGMKFKHIMTLDIGL